MKGSDPKVNSDLMKTSDLSAHSETCNSQKMRKTVTFQVYDAKNMEELTEMRAQMHEKFNSLNESFQRARSPPKLTPEQQRERQLKKIIRLTETLQQVRNKCSIVNKLRTLETLQSYSNRIQIIEARLQHWHCAKYSKECFKELNAYRKHRHFRKVKKLEEEHTCAQYLLTVRYPRMLRGCFGAAKCILGQEKLWLKEVRQALGINLKSETLNSMQLFVIYNRIKRMCEIERKSAFVLQLC